MPAFIKEIITDPKSLKQQCQSIRKLVANELLDEIVISLIDTYNANMLKCVGLSANQIGYQSRIILVRLKTNFVIMINPEVIPSLMHGLITKKETCLSYPDKITRVKRYKRITVSYAPYAKTVVPRLTHTFTGIEARIIQHEIDHINGVNI